MEVHSWNQNNCNLYVDGGDILIRTIAALKSYQYYVYAQMDIWGPYLKKKKSYFKRVFAIILNLTIREENNKEENWRF